MLESLIDSVRRLVAAPMNSTIASIAVLSSSVKLSLMSRNSRAPDYALGMSEGMRSLNASFLMPFW